MIKVLFQHKCDTLITLLMPALLSAMTVTHNFVFLYAILGLCVCRIHKPVVIFPVYFIASLSTAYFVISEGVSAGRFLSLIMIISLVIDIVRKGGNHQVDGYFPLWILFVVYCFISAVLSVTGSLVPFALLIQGLLVLLLLPKIKEMDVEYFCSLLYFACLIAFIGVWVQFVSIGFDQLLYERYKGIEGETNSNRIAMMVMQMGLVIISPFIANEKNKVIRWVSVVGFILAIVIIILTGSRASLLASLMAFFILFFELSRQNFKKYIIPAVVVTGVALVVVQQFSLVDSVVLDRFSLQSLEDSGGSDRMPAIQILLTHIFPQYPLFGVGLGGANFNAVAILYGMDHPCHNIFFDSLAQLGLVGVIIFICLCFKIFRNTWKSFNYATYQFPFIIALLLTFGAVINGMGETVYVEKWFWNALSLCLFFTANKDCYIEWGNTKH